MNGNLCQARCWRLWQRNLDFEQRLGRYSHTCVSKDVSVAAASAGQNLWSRLRNKKRGWIGGDQNRGRNLAGDIRTRRNFRVGNRYECVRDAREEGRRMTRVQKIPRQPCYESRTRELTREYEWLVTCNACSRISTHFRTRSLR